MSKFWYLPISILLLMLSTTALNIANIMKGEPIISFDYSAIIIFASLGVAISLEFVYLFVEKMVLEQW